jgi:subtilisin family serine protease
MSVGAASLRLLDRIRGRERVSADDPLARRLREWTHLLHPDPLFERRLRGEVLNRHVAAREGGGSVPRSRQRELGALGRAVLYASFALAVGVTAVGAAAQGAVPGDPLYPVKLRIEELRIEVAPAGIRPQLIAARLDERLAELEVLAARGAWSEVVTAARRVDDTAMRLEAFGLGADTPGHDAIERHAEILAALAAEAPAAAREGLARAIEASSAATGQVTTDLGARPADGSGPSQPGADSGQSETSPHPRPSIQPRPH